MINWRQAKVSDRKPDKDLRVQQLTSLFYRLVLPVIAIIGLCFVMYFVLKKPIDVMEETMSTSTEARIDDIRGYDKLVYEAMLDELSNEKVKFYVIMIGEFLILMLFGFHVFKALLRVDANFLIDPDRYEIVTKDDAELIRRIRCELEEAGRIGPRQSLNEADIKVLLAPADNEGRVS